MLKVSELQVANQLFSNSLTKNYSMNGTELFYGSQVVRVEIYQKLNTLLPSSVSVERLIISRADILRHKRSCLAFQNFEKLVSRRPISEFSRRTRRRQWGRKTACDLIHRASVLLFPYDHRRFVGDIIFIGMWKTGVH